MKRSIVGSICRQLMYSTNAARCCALQHLQGMEAGLSTLATEFPDDGKGKALVLKEYGKVEDALHMVHQEKPAAQSLGDNQVLMRILAVR